MPVKNQYSELLKMSSPCEKLIRRDIARTYPEHEFFKGQDSLGQEVLFNVMKVSTAEFDITSRSGNDIVIYEFGIHTMSDFVGHLLVCSSGTRCRGYGLKIVKNQASRWLTEV